MIYTKWDSCTYLFSKEEIAEERPGGSYNVLSALTPVFTLHAKGRGVMITLSPIWEHLTFGWRLADYDLFAIQILENVLYYFCKGTIHW